jgi:hypothetical protein
MQMEEQVILPKGQSIKFLDYVIQNSLNNDGLVLSKNNGKLYETHLGNYGTGTQENIDTCKRYAILYFMAARPRTFATTMVRKAIKPNGGTYHEYFLLKQCCKDEDIELPDEIEAGNGMNCMIYFKGKPLSAGQ